MTQSKGQVIVVEDDAKIAQLLVDYLERAGFSVRHFFDARGVVDVVNTSEPDAVLLDITLPAGNGLSLCQSLREFSDVPIMFITARADEEERVDGIRTGADDYVVKPFSPREVVARIEAMIRRARGQVVTDPTRRPYVVDQPTRRIAIDGQWLDLSPNEFAILSRLMSRLDRVWSRAELLDHIVDDSAETGERAIDSHIKNIRRKMASVDAAGFKIKSVYGAGYCFTEAR